MKKYLFTFLTIMLALFMVACDPSTPSQSEPSLDVPEWATGEYTTTVLSLPMPLTITETSIEVKAPVVGLISSNSANLDDCYLSSDGEWVVVLSGISVTIDKIYENNTVTIRLKSVTPNTVLSGSITIEEGSSLLGSSVGSFINPALASLTFTLPESCVE